MKKVHQIVGILTGYEEPYQKGDFTKQPILVEEKIGEDFKGNPGDPIKIDFMGDWGTKALKKANLEIGDPVAVDFTVFGREYNGRNFINLTGRYIRKLDQQEYDSYEAGSALEFNDAGIDKPHDSDKLPWE